MKSAVAHRSAWSMRRVHSYGAGWADICGSYTCQLVYNLNEADYEVWSESFSGPN